MRLAGLGSARRRLTAAVLLTGLVLLIAGLGVWRLNSRTPAPPSFQVPTLAGLNYGVPRSVNGEWVGNRWLRPDYWETTRPAFAADLDFIQRHDLGRVQRIFVGLDQTMIWDQSQGFVGFDESTLQHFSDALDMLDAHQMKVIAVLYDQEEVGSSGNFHFEALDGSHQAMRQNYLRAAHAFLERFGARDTVIGWDLFNEPYNSLGPDGHLPRPPHQDPVSPNYSDQSVHDWMRDLYQTAKQAAPDARFTFSDTTELYWNPDPVLSKYDDVVDFYDIHVYDDNPKYPNWRSMLHKPYVVGEAGASTANQHYENQTINSKAVTYLLQHAQPAGVSFVLAQGQAFSTTRDSLTPTGAAVADFLAGDKSRAGVNTGWDPVGEVVAAAVTAGRCLKRFLAF